MRTSQGKWCNYISSAKKENNTINQQLYKIQPRSIIRNTLKKNEVRLQGTISNMLNEKGSGQNITPRISNTSTAHPSVVRPTFSPWCVRRVTEACKNAQLIIIKEIKLSMDLAEALMIAIPNLKVIHLVRDIRGMVNSRANIGKRVATIKSGALSNVLCKEMQKDIATATILKRKYPDRITTVMYEAMAERPTEAAKYIYRFLNITYDKTVDEWINRTAHGNKTSGPQGTQRADSKKTANQWRLEQPFNIANITQNVCRKVFDLLGYIPFKTQSEMANMTLKSRRTANIEGFT